MRESVGRVAARRASGGQCGARDPLRRAPSDESRDENMRACLWVWATTATLLALAAVAVARNDQDFEFDDDDAEAPTGAVAGGSHVRRARRYVYDPHNPLCRSLVCKKREVCVLRDAFTALCATKKAIARNGDVLVAADSGDEDVFYEREAADDDAHFDLDDDKPDRCVGCPARARGQFLCGSDNRTYSSLCRLDLHNCVRRGQPPVRLACRGFCPCAPAPAPAPHRRRPSAPPAPRRRRPAHRANDVLPDDAADCALDRMADRLLDWFSVLMEEAGARGEPPRAGFPRDCKPEVRWMFEHLDADADGALSAADLYALRHDERERCLRPFLASCGGEGGGAGVSRGEWCGCLRRAARPCTALARAHGGARARGAYVPACDEAGFYRPRQCHSALGVCWCVDPHGVERPGSRTKGAPDCGVAHPPLRETGEGAEGGEGAPADDEDEDGGSGDRDLRF